MTPGHLQPCTRLDLAAREALFAGAVLRFSDNSEVNALIDAIRVDIAAAMAPHKPLEACRDIAADELHERTQALFHRAAREPLWNDLLDQVLVALGCDPVTTHRDRLRLRIQSSDDPHDRAALMTLDPHRDSWGSNVQAQVNWWAPIFDIDVGRTIAMWPDLFDRPVANTSAAWDYDALIASRKNGQTDYPVVPVVTEPQTLREPVPVVIAPGEILAFSGAHLHASVPNQTGLMRYSIEVRTVDLGDMETGRGAPNVDAA
ncbi:MAG: hypothetical protein P8Q36_01860, partial [Alphaproteobacteria bacterium]|nr:hypothetical protein [Alphaproteobacteria bacterium]